MTQRHRWLQLRGAAPGCVRREVRRGRRGRSRLQPPPSEEEFDSAVVATIQWPSLAHNAVWDPDAGLWHPTDGKHYSPEIYREGPIVPRKWTSNPFPANGAEAWTDAPHRYYGGRYLAAEPSVVYAV